MSLQQSAVGMHFIPQRSSLPGQHSPMPMQTPLPQSLRVEGQMQRPFVQTSAPGQTVVQELQWFLSVFRFTQRLTLLHQD